MLDRRRIKLAFAIAVAIVAATGPPAARADPAVSAPAAIAVEPATGEVVFARNASSERPIASTTKLMTALVTLENTELDDTVRTVAYHGLAVESTGGFKGGEKVTIRTLLQALLVASANDAANTLAIRVGGSRERFVAMMNERAREAGLTHTHFANPIGLDAPGNYSSAIDLVRLALLLRQDPFIRATTDRPSVTIRSGGRTRTLKNRNLLIAREPFVNGMKTGHTIGAGWVLVGSGTRDGVSVVTAVLGAASESARIADTLSLMRYTLRRYRVATPVRKGAVYGSVGLKSRSQSVDVVASQTLRKTIRRGTKVTLSPELPAEIDGPLDAGAQVGTLNVLYGGKVVERVGLIVRQPVSAATTADVVKDRLFGPLGLVIGAAVLCTLVMLRRRRAAKRRRRVAAADPGARIA